MQAGERDALDVRAYEAIVRHAYDVITVVDAEGLVRFVSGAARRVLGHDPDAAEGSEAVSWVHPEDVPVMLERRSWLLGATGRTTTTVLRVRQADGGWRHVETHGVNLLDDPHVAGLLYVTRDVEGRARAEINLVHALGAQRVVADLGLRALQAHAVEDLLLDGLERVASLLGADYVTLLLLDDRGRLAVRVQVGDDPLPPGHLCQGGPRSQAARTLATRHPVVVEDVRHDERVEPTDEQRQRGVVAGVDVPLEAPEGPLGVLAAHTTTPRSFSPVDVQFLQGVANVLAGALVREQRERSALHQALHDPLTGLPTRPLFDDRLEHALARVRRGAGDLALLLIDLDRFKSVNDVFGHQAGDEVLRALGPRLAECARASDTVARYGGDEFVVLCEDDLTHVGVARVAASIRRACAQPVTLSTGESVLLSASVGTAWSVDEGADGAALLAAADASMYRDKRLSAS